MKALPTLFSLVVLAAVLLPAPPAHAGAAPELAERARHLAELLESPETQLTTAQRRDVQAYLDATWAVANAPRADYMSACFVQAYHLLPRDQSRQLCAGGGSVDTVLCYREAHRELTSEDAIRLCKGGGTLRTADCFAHASRQLTTSRSLALCENRGTEETAACYELAYRRLSASQALALCKGGGTRDRLQCLDEAYSHTTLAEAAQQCQGQ